jgi:arsenite-transporting ATPase
MAPRTILYTGKGGVGKTSVAAATARRCAREGRRTLILSTDPAHSLADSLQARLGAEPAQVDERLFAEQVDSQQELERHWAAVQSWVSEMLIDHGVQRISAEELAVPPGLDELFALSELKRQHASGEWQTIVVDCAPTGETLRLLSVPDVARWWLEKVLPRERELLAMARPIARSLLDIPVPGPEIFADVRRLTSSLIEMNELLRDGRHASVRLVMNPDRMVIQEAMRTFTYLNLYGYLTDAVVVNRIFPAEVDAYFGAWRERQQELLERVQEGFAPVPVLRAPYFRREVLGAEMLDRLGDALFSQRDAPDAVLHETLAQELSIDGGIARVRLALPFASKSDVTLKKIGHELVVRVGDAKRIVMLPPALAGFAPARASFEDGTLEVCLCAERDGTPATAPVGASAAGTAPAARSAPGSSAPGGRGA